MKNFSLLFALLTCCILLTWCFNNTQVIDDCIIPEDCIENSDLQQAYLVGYWMEPFWDIEISWWIATFSSPMYDTNVVEPITIRQEWENYYFSGENLEWEFILKDCIDGWKWDMHYYTVWVAKIRDYYYEWCGDGIEWIKMSDEVYVQQHEEFMSKFSWNIKSCEQNLENILKMAEEDAININYGWYDYVNIWESYKVNWYITYTLGNEYVTKDTTCTFLESDLTDWWEFWNWEIEYRWHWNILWLAWNIEEENCLYSLNQYEPEKMDWNSDTTISISCYPKDYYWPEYITWYVYTTTYSDLWLRISTPWAAWINDMMDIFLNKSKAPIFTRSWNRISYINPRVNEEIEYIQVYKKSESESLKNIIEKEYLNLDDTNCYIFERNYYDQNKISAPYPWTIIYDISSNWNSYENECIKNKKDYNIIRFFESPDKTKYYEIDFWDWCAPWPCSMFWTVEVF